MTRSRTVLLVALAAVFLAGCAGVVIPEPAWLQEARAREAKPLPTKKIRSQDRFFRAKVPAKLLRPIERDEGSYHVALDIGTPSAVDCWVYRDSIDWGSSLAMLSEATFEGIDEGSDGGLRARAIDKVDSGAMGSRPFLALDWMYTVQTDAGMQVGIVKHMVAEKDGRSLYCQHNEVGYEKSFRRTVSALVSSLRYAKPAGPKPYYSAVTTLAIGDKPVGLEHTELTRDSDGDTRILRTTSLLLAVDRDTLQVHDSVDIEFARPNGSLINQVHIESQNGELMTQLRLDPLRVGAWKAHGTYQGKALEAELAASGPVDSWLSETFALRRGLKKGGTGTSVTSRRWIPDADPTRFIDGTLEVGRPVLGSKSFQARVETAGINADVVVDRAGTVESGSMEMGPARMTIERVYAGGKL